jgi:hypothetical protein
VNVVERFLNFWRPRPADDHPLTAEERDEDTPAMAYDERARRDRVRRRRLRSGRSELDDS